MKSKQSQECLPPPKSLVERMDRLDKSISSYWHNLNWRVFEVLLIPYAKIHNPWGCLLLSQVITWYLCQQNAALEQTVVTLEEKVSMFLNFAFYVLVSANISNFLKKLIARPRPHNPQEGSPNVRYFNLRGHEHNHSLPSGDTL